MKPHRATGLTLILLAALALAACVPVGVVQQVPPPPATQPAAATALQAPEPAPTEPAAAEPAGNAGLANPASVNCTDQGGALTIEKRGDQGEFGVCTFGEGRECEEWALLRGYCPAGGVRVTGFVTPAARYCAITGGAYEATGDTGLETEKGICTLPDGVECDVWEYYDGKCSS